MGYGYDWQHPRIFDDLRPTIATNLAEFLGNPCLPTFTIQTASLHLLLMG